jgi:carbamoylphosphate synthase large subunit
MKHRVQLRSRHPSHKPLRLLLPKFPFRSVVRLGSTTEIPNSTVEINSIQSIKNSADKLLMKQCFTENNVRTAIWSNGSSIDTILNILSDNYKGEVPYPIVAKYRFGSRGNGIYLIKTKEEFNNWIPGKTLTNYIFEKFYNYNKEYRLHVTKDGCFYTCRKMLKSDTAEDKRWFRNDSNSVWIIEENEQFDKPVNWDNVISESVKALNAVGLDVGAVDLRIQSRLDKDGRIRTNPEFIVVEINSAASHADGTRAKYLEIIPKLINSKYENRTT